MKLIWASDVHLNFLKDEGRVEFYNNLEAAKGDAIVVSGDIAESHNVVQMVREMEEHTKLPVYFVLGNHDFYGSSVEKVKKSVKKLNWLPSKHVVALSDHTALVGVDGWGDCRNGDYENSRLVMSDWMYIDELRRGYGARDNPMQKLKEALQTLADEDAKAIKRKINAALKKGFKRIIIVSHVPPFEEASLYAGRKSTPSGLPFFSSKCLGDVILPIAKKHEDVEFLWLSGHTHSKVTYVPLPNVTVRVAYSEYRFPQIEETFDV